MELYIIRHAWAGHQGDPRWPNDAQRPLSEEGKQRFAEEVDRLAERGFSPKIIATSPMVRCRQTAELVAKGVAGKPAVVELDELLPGGNLEGLLAWTAKQSEEHDAIAWVGHAPDVGLLAAALIGNGEVSIDFAKGAVSAIRFENEPRSGQGELRWLATAKMLGC